jgi:hypothetical protein
VSSPTSLVPSCTAPRLRLVPSEDVKAPTSASIPSGRIREPKPAHTVEMIKRTASDGGVFRASPMYEMESTIKVSIIAKLFVHTMVRTRGRSVDSAAVSRRWIEFLRHLLLYTISVERNGSVHGAEEATQSRRSLRTSLSRDRLRSRIRSLLVMQPPDYLPD